MSHNHASTRFEGAPEASTSFLRDVVRGLQSRERNIPCKWLYDAKGTALFEQICGTRDYYVTRVEMGLLQTHARAWAAHAGEGTEVLEPGAGSGEKAAVLLSEMLAPAGYLPLEISPSASELAQRTVARRCPGLPIEPRIGDFTVAHHVARLTRSKRRLLFFPGSTIGNFEPAERAGLIQNFRSWLRPGDLFLVGVDLVKERGVLEQAYDDREGVTSAFNLNLLRRMQTELNASVSMDAFRHRAVFNESRRRIEMHLVSERRHTLSVGGHNFTFLPGEFIHTENSHKFTVQEFAEEVARFAFRPLEHREDPSQYFSLQLFEAV